MGRAITKTLLILPACAAALIGVAAFASAPLPEAQPLRAIPVRTITISLAPPAPAEARPLHVAPGLRFSRLGADGCGVVTRAVVGEGGRIERRRESFCRH